MKIVFQHSGILPVVKYGGIERILFWHMKELVKRGHEVVLFGGRGSQVASHGIEFFEMPENYETFEEMIPRDADILHVTYNPELKKSNIPTLINIQGNGQIGEEFPQNTVFVSKKHAANHNSKTFIYNAVDLDEYPFEDRPFRLDNLLFLAKGSWSVKNLKDSIWMAKRSKKTLHIAGGRSWLPSRFVHSYGMVGGEEKLDLLQKTDALLFPVRWHEPFGIAIIEAMACGSPVFGTPYGSLPELIFEPFGRTFNHREDLLNHLKSSPKYNRLEIRRYVEKEFSIRRLTTEYLTLYEKILDGESLNSHKPSWSLDKPPLELLSF
ncbi:MAG: glycosyltransferase [Bacteriovoracaceae bacterium]|nr:glycosyltransferase [Bacteriovoracaceae bacterium]